MFRWWTEKRRASAHRRLERQYRELLKEARDLQRAGDIRAFAAKTAQAEELWQKIEDGKIAAQSTPAVDG